MFGAKRNSAFVVANLQIGSWVFFCLPKRKALAKARALSSNQFPIAAFAVN
jgi:hypothetical protein